MAATDTDLAILGMLGRIAKGSQAAQAAFATGDNFWQRWYDTADDDFMNVDKGQVMEDVDTTLASGYNFSNYKLRNFFTYLLAYMRIAPTPADSFSEWLSNNARRIPYGANEAYYDGFNARMAATQVFPAGTLPADEATDADSGMVLLGTYAAGAITGVQVLPATVGPAAVVAINQSASQTVAATLRCYNHVAPATYKDIALSLSSAAQYSQTFLGQQALAAGAAEGTSALQVASTTAFTAGEYVLVWESDDLQEVALVASLGTGPTRLVLSSALKETYTTSAVVRPLFRSVAYVSGAGGSGNVNLYAAPDRTIAL